MPVDYEGKAIDIAFDPKFLHIRKISGIFTAHFEFIVCHAWLEKHALRSSGRAGVWNFFLRLGTTDLARVPAPGDSPRP